MLDKGAVTRMENTKRKAKQMSMPGNRAAQMSLRKQTSEVKGPKAPVAPAVDYQALAPQPPAPVDLPSGPPPISVPPEFDPGVFKEDVKDNLVGQIKTQEFLNSPLVQDAQTSIVLKEFLNGGNPNRKPDPRDFLDRVVDRIGMGHVREQA